MKLIGGRRQNQSNYKLKLYERRGRNRKSRKKGKNI